MSGFFFAALGTVCHVQLVLFTGSLYNVLYMEAIKWKQKNYMTANISGDIAEHLTTWYAQAIFHEVAYVC